MKSFLPIAIAAMLIAIPASAQDHKGHATAAGPAPAPATPAPIAAAKFSLDTPLETIVADPAAKAVLDANLPGLSTNQAFPMIKAMSLSQLSAMAPGRLPPAALTKVGTALAAVK